ncbi:Thiosulfate sulfurtransferase GlpE [Piscirickettsia salmonis]|uniref:rhodanese-like domain-containing protein n=1 Tax=Piscirickettsia salmonis TaxID=1238 RepID=UPI0012B92C95|nr:rhodanese-like domain-containing protein [Piscirickettsia salmonis]QGP48756.1 Thiosulfate sulfurtransferase GlpE [Piscirickettsia salmonis]QGP52782.1 Thiosulfate sulfurtransferase GlpE [Piscirickettsia salmonis]QGP57645.1 Thiosulfate sulfurtransferase GlpE [Piscirickettsia salmonis]QGP62350.1 Thiosulfate sulfurtransferase GlpE [Piscirickettsia salmonis]
MDKLIPFLTEHYILVSLFILVLILFLLHEFRLRSRGVKRLSPQDLTLVINRQKGIIIDVRDSKQFANGHIANARNYPKTQLEEFLPKLEKHKSRPIVLICESGTHSTAAGSLLKKKGFEQVYSLAEGLTSWKKDSYPLVK